MTDHKYTDDEVIRALECCANTLECRNCPLFDEDNCTYRNINYVLDLINRQRAEIEILNEIVFMDRTEAIKALKAEAIKEFAERLETALLVGGIYPVIVKRTIHRLAEEMIRGEINQ